MADYKDPDEFFDKSLVDFGVGAGRESIRSNLKATNGAAHRTEVVANAVKDAVGKLADKVVEAIAARRWVYDNQDHKKPEDRGTNNLFEAVRATNGRVFHPGFGLEALAKRLDAIEAKLDGKVTDQP